MQPTSNRAEMILMSGTMEKLPFHNRASLALAAFLGLSKTRHFILFSDGQLDYYKSEEKYREGIHKRKGFLVLAPNALILGNDLLPDSLMISQDSSTYRLKCQNREDCMSWVRAMKKCIERLKSPALDRIFNSFSLAASVAIRPRGGTSAIILVDASVNIANPAVVNAGLLSTTVVADISTTAPSSYPKQITKLSLNDFPRHATSVDKLVTLSYMGDLDGVAEILREFPTIIGVLGRVFSQNETTGEWFIEKLTYALPAALKNEHQDVAQYLMQFEKKSLSTSASKSISGGRRSVASCGFHPSHMDRVFLASVAVRSMTDMPLWCGRPMTKLDEKYSNIMVERRGKVSDNNDAFMITDGIIMEVEKAARYAININALTGIPEIKKLKTSDEAIVKSWSTIPDGFHPRYLEVTYSWDAEMVLDDKDDANIFGKNSLLMVDADILTVPVNETTLENLAFFDAELITPDDIFEFEVPHQIDCLPLTVMRVGKDYVDGFIMQDTVGGEGFSGAYLEWHDVPHFHMPLNNKNQGFLILGKMQDDKMLLGAFKLKFGTAVYMHPWTLHNDCFLVGDYAVVYASTENFQTGTVIATETCTPAAFKFV